MQDLRFVLRSSRELYFVDFFLLEPVYQLMQHLRAG